MTSSISGAQVNVYADDPEMLPAFYEKLDLIEKFRIPATGNPDQVELPAGNIRLGFARKETLRRLAGLPVEFGPSTTEVVLWCNNSADLYARTLNLGATSVAPPKIFNARICASWVSDPEGNRLKLVSPVE